MRKPHLPSSLTPPSPRLGALGLALAVGVVGASLPLTASSHREAPFITENPKVDGTDFYMFRSYEPGREGFVTLIANYIPLQDAYGGPNYFTMDPAARYRINIENDGDSVEDLVFEFQFTNPLRRDALDVGGEDVEVPLRTITPLGVGIGPNQDELYTVRVIRGGGAPDLAGNRTLGGNLFFKAKDNIGGKTLPDYETYAASHIYDIQIPGCEDGRIFAGQRKESFAVNLGEVFDLINLNPVGDPAAKRSTTDDKNITSLILEVPTDCLTGGNGPVIGGWTTALLPRSRNLNPDPTYGNPSFNSDELIQVSRLGMPLVNEVVIGLGDKNKFNASHPKNDLANFATYVTNPTLAEIIEILFQVDAPNNFPRADLVATFVTGIDGLNLFGLGEMQRLNTEIPPTPKDDQNSLGVIGGDNAGFPNGRRPGDDVVDIELRVVMGVLCHVGLGLCDPGDAPSGLLPFTDQAYQGPDQFDDAFPYLTTPLPGSPNAYRTFNANLEGGQEVPPVDTQAAGACGAVLSPDGSALAISCTHDVVNPVAAHIHLAPAGTNGPIVCNMGNGQSPIQFVCDSGNVTDFAAFLVALQQGNTYVNVHSGTNPGGELRGQVR